MNFRKSISKRKPVVPRYAPHSYQPLEPRRMLTVDIGLTTTTSTFDNTTSFFAPDVNGDIGPNHIVQVVNGEYSVRTLNGTAIQTQTLEVFWQAAGADISVDTDVSGNPILGTIQDSRVVFDHSSGRFFVSAVLAERDGSRLFGNDILLAVSRTSDPIDGFQAVQFVGDTSLIRYNEFATLAVGGNGVFISTNNVTAALNRTVSVYALPKADLLGITPGASGIQRFENMNPNVVGRTIQFATDLNGDATRTLGVGTFSNGTTISLFEITGLETGTATLNQFAVTVPAYTAAPGGRQPNAIAPLNNISPDFTASAVSQNGYLWAVSTVAGSFSNSAIRWYQVDEATGLLLNSGQIEDPNLDFLYPSIAVNEFGVIAIGFTATGLTFSPSSFLTMGFTTRGLDAVPTVSFPQDPVLLQSGLDNFVNIQNGINPWGEYTATRFDPDDPFSFYTFQEFVPVDDTWGITLGRVRLNNIAPVINANNLDNEIVVRRSAINDQWVEIMIDGNVTDVFELSTVDSLGFNLMDGNDTFVVDQSLGLIATEFGFEVNGGLGMDAFQVFDVNGHRFDITGDGSGIFDLVNNFSGFEILVGSDGDDIFSASNSTTDWELNGMAGNDLFDLGNSATGMFLLQGMLGDDTYRVPIANAGSIIVVDSIGSENDTLLSVGSEMDDEFLVINGTVVFNGTNISGFTFPGIESVALDGIEGNDTFLVQAIQQDYQIFGSSGDDLFIVSSNAPLETGNLAGIVNQLFIDGADGNNRLIVSNRLGAPVDATIMADQLLNLAPSTIHYSGNFVGDGVTAGIEIIGSDLGADRFDVTQFAAGNSLLVRGGFGDDTFIARDATLGQVIFDGNSGNDVYRTSVGSADRRVEVRDTGADLARDRYSIRATDFADQLVVVGNQFAVLTQVYAWSGLENLILDLLGENDTITVGNNATSFIRVVMGLGNDTAGVTGTIGISTLRFDGNEGNDLFQFNSSTANTFVQGRGGDGNDTLLVGELSFGRTRVDGEGGNDQVTVAFASRDGRRVNARDNGSGNDQLTITGTPTADRIALRPRVIDREGEFITYDENTETLNMNLLGSNDVVNVFGTAAERVDANLGIGNDTVNVFSTASSRDSILLSFLLSSGSDVGNVFKVSESARVEIFGQAGDDTFNVGSNPVDDNGNLNRIRGQLFVGGGAELPGSDTLHINDRGGGAAGYNYRISDTQISHDQTSNVNRPFESFNYNDMEFILVAGTDGRNVFTVTPSLTTVIRVDGNNHPLPASLFGDRLNVIVPVGGSNMNNNGSSGFISFDAGFRNVSFQEVEFVSATNGGSSSLADPIHGSGGLILPRRSDSNGPLEINLDEVVSEYLFELMELEI